MAGYSGTPLAAKLGVSAGRRVAVLGAPGGFVASLAAPEGTHLQSRLGGRFDVIVCFVLQRAVLHSCLPGLLRALKPAGALWIAWPKRSSPLRRPAGGATAPRATPIDLDEGAVREVLLATGLVDNKVCAIDDSWSGLRFVLRLADR